MKEVILTGLRANNDLHIGNYFGALLPLVDMAKTRSDEFQINLFVPDLHSFTTPIDHSQLEGQIMSNVRLFAAAGLPLDQADIRVYRQSYVPAHSELTVILDSFAYFDELYRMTQFKQKSGAANMVGTDFVLNRFAKDYVNHSSVSRLKNEIRDFDGTKEELQHKFQSYVDDLSVRGHEVFAVRRNSSNGSATLGLFNYPVLMAADILLYGASYVPVGDDQSQHLEFTRDIAERMNSKFGGLFTVPKAVKEQHEFFGKDQGLRIKDLADPSKKMSKSDESGKGIIFLGDDPEEAAKKIMSAATDSFGEVKLDFAERPGISNLLQIHALLSGRSLEDVAKQYQGQTSYGDLKKDVAEGVKAFLADFQARLAQVDESVLVAKLEADEAAMNIVANQTLLRVQQAVGLRK